MDITELEAWLWATPNSRRVSLLLEELGLSYHVHPVNIRRQEQFAPDILALNPYGKLPILRWREGGEHRVMSESGAILLYFAEQSGRLLPSDGKARAQALQWFMFAMTSLGPMTGQAHHWTELASEKPLAAQQHSLALARRAYGVLEGHLAPNHRAQGEGFLAGAFSLADIAAYPWVAVHDWAQIDLADYPAIAAWMARVEERPATARGMAVPHGARLE
jgi:GST-like protein